MTDHEDGDDPQLQSLRAVWLSMPDEDPPQRGLAELMSAARIKAEEMAKPSLWQRIAATLRRPPVLALASILVLIGGAVFIGQRADKMEAPIGAVESRPSLPSESRLSSQPPATGSAAASVPPEAPAPEAADSVAPEPEPEAPKAERKQPRPPARRDGKEVEAQLRGGRAEGAKLERAPGHDEKTVVRPDEATAGRDGTFASEGDGERDVGATTATPAPLQETSEPRANAEDAPRAGATDARTGTTNARTGTTGAPSRFAQYVQQARSAASRGDCVAAKRSLDAAKQVDAAAYRKAIARDGALKKCVAY